MLDFIITLNDCLKYFIIYILNSLFLSFRTLSLKKVLFKFLNQNYRVYFVSNVKLIKTLISLNYYLSFHTFTLNKIWFGLDPAAQSKTRTLLITCWPTRNLICYSYFAVRSKTNLSFTRANISTTSSAPRNIDNMRRYNDKVYTYSSRKTVQGGGNSCLSLTTPVEIYKAFQDDS